MIEQNSCIRSSPLATYLLVRLNLRDREIVTDNFLPDTERGLKVLYSTAHLTADNHKTPTAMKTNAK